MSEIRPFLIYAASLSLLLLGLIAAAFALFVDLWFAASMLPVHLIACVFLLSVLIWTAMTHRIGKPALAGFVAAGVVLVEVSIRYVSWA